MGYGINPVSRRPNDARRLYHAQRAQALSPLAAIPRRAQPHHPCQLTVGRRGRNRRLLAPSGHGATMVTRTKRTQRKEPCEGHHLYRRLGPIKSGTRRLRRRAQIHQPAGKTFTSELSRGYAKTTNNRMELMAVIVALERSTAPATSKSIPIRSTSSTPLTSTGSTAGKNAAGRPPTSSLSRTAICGSACSPQRASTKWSSSGLRATPAMSSMSAATSLPPRRRRSNLDIDAGLTRATCNGVFAHYFLPPRATLIL